MKINRRTEGPIEILEPVGDMGLYNLGQLRELLQELRESGKLKVLISMASVPGIDSISIGFLIQETTLFSEAAGELKIARISPAVRKSLQVTETLSQINLYEDVDSALAAFKDFRG
jgi:anti-sigma B factor antagonist